MTECHSQVRHRCFEWLSHLLSSSRVDFPALWWKNPVITDLASLDVDPQCEQMNSWYHGKRVKKHVSYSCLSFFRPFQGRKAGSLHFPGTACTYDGETAMIQEVEPILYDYKNETAWQVNTDKVMSWFRDQDLDFVSMYFGEPDGTGHRYGPDSPQRREMVAQVDRQVGYIRESVNRHGLSDHLNIIITADHGMATVLRGGLVEEIILSKIPGFSFSDLSFHLVDYGPSGMLLPKPGMLDKVYNALKGAHPHLHVYKKEDMPEHLHFSKNERILPIILWADIGYVINGVRSIFIPPQQTNKQIPEIQLLNVTMLPDHSSGRTRQVGCFLWHYRLGFWPEMKHAGAVKRCAAAVFCPLQVLLIYPLKSTVTSVCHLCPTSVPSAALKEKKTAPKCGETLLQRCSDAQISCFNGTLIVTY